LHNLAFFMNGLARTRAIPLFAEKQSRFVPTASHTGYFVCALALAVVTLGDAWGAVAGVPGEASTGILYVVTHLPFATYLILFFILVLSVANLIFQGLGSHQLWRPLDILRASLERKGNPSGGGWSLGGFKWSRKHLTRPGRAHGASSLSPAGERVSDGVLAVRKVNGRQNASGPSMPTPLEGMNHRLPQFSAHVGSEPGSPRVYDQKASKEALAPEFKFSSAVDLPSQEELERREKEQLVVAGSVVGLDGEAIDSVIVYLMDEEGNRIGQSCRSAPETGEFKVLVKEPGQYTLTAYKRGLILEVTEPMALPIESGKIEGYTVRMIPEGCLLHGKVINETPTSLGPVFEVRCHWGGQGAFRSVLTDSAGGFRMSGVPHNSECHIQVIDKEGRTFAVSEKFETGEKKEIVMNVAITNVEAPEVESSPSDKDPDPSQEPVAEASPQSAGSSQPPA
jgi:hypothetical protein